MDRLRVYENVDHVLGVLAEMHEAIARAISELSDQRTIKSGDHTQESCGASKPPGPQPSLNPLSFEKASAGGAKHECIGSGGGEDRH